MEKREEKTGERKEEEAAKQSFLFLRFPARSLLDRVDILTKASRHVTLHYGQLDQRLVVWKLAVLIENRAVSVVSFSQTLLSLILLYSKNRLFLMICML